MWELRKYQLLLSVLKFDALVIIKIGIFTLIYSLDASHSRAKYLLLFCKKYEQLHKCELCDKYRIKII